MFYCLCPAVLLFLLFPFMSAAPVVQFLLNADQTVNISVNGATWFVTNDIMFHAANTSYSVRDASLVIQSSTTVSGQDNLGYYTAYQQIYEAVNSNLRWQIAYRLYQLDSSTPISVNIRAIVFEQLWLNAVNDSSVGNINHVSSAFPSFRVSAATVTLGALQWGDTFLQSKGFVWSGPNATISSLYGGSIGGPIALFDQSGQVNAVLSPFSNFMAASISNAATSTIVQAGLLGTITSVPAGYSLETVLSFNDQGITAGMIAWGDLLLARYHRRREAMYDDFTTQYLGYATDNGAYYYYHTEGNMTYADTLIAVQEYADKLGIPYQYMLLDSWWYFKGVNNGCKNWTAMPSIFPNGLQDFHSKLQYPLMAHNRYWSSDTDYAKQNGGKYDFLIDGQVSLPITQVFWNDLIAQGTVWSDK